MRKAAIRSRGKCFYIDFYVRLAGANKCKETATKLAVTYANFGALAQHKAVIFFFIFTAIFTGIGMVVGACSPCFVPISVLHVVSVTLASKFKSVAGVGLKLRASISRLWLSSTF